MAASQLPEKLSVKLYSKLIKFLQNCPKRYYWNFPQHFSGPEIVLEIFLKGYQHYCQWKDDFFNSENNSPLSLHSQMHADWKDFSIQLDGSKKNLSSCTAATPLTTAIEPAHVAANNCVQKLQVAAWRGGGGTGPPLHAARGDEKRRACMKGLSQTSTTSRSLDSYVSATP